MKLKKEKDMYICPKCSENLIKIGNTLKCASGHSYDISSSGYVNLLISNKSTGVHGDNKEMIAARRRFLSLDHYSPIIYKLNDLITEYASQNGVKSPIILDAGCGEGYYSGRVCKGLSKGLAVSPVFYAADVSKDAVTKAAKSYKIVNFSVVFPEHS